MSLQTWNNIDEISLYLGLDRLDSETDEDFYKRIKKFGKWRYKTDYLTQVHSIPLQLGMDTDAVLKIKCNNNYICKVDWEYFYLYNDNEAIRVFIGNENDTLSKILDAIDNSEEFTYSLYDEDSRDILCKFLVRNTNVKIYKDYIPQNRYKLRYSNIVSGSLLSNNNLLLRNRRSKIADLKRIGDYFLDEETGYIEIVYPEFDGEYLTYKYYDSSFYIESTDINLTPINIISKYGMTDKMIAISEYLLSDKVMG